MLDLNNCKHFSERKRRDGSVQNTCEGRRTEKLHNFPLCSEVLCQPFHFYDIRGGGGGVPKWWLEKQTNRFDYHECHSSVQWVGAAQQLLNLSLSSDQAGCRQEHIRTLLRTETRSIPRMKRFQTETSKCLSIYLHVPSWSSALKAVSPPPSPQQ